MKNILLLTALVCCFAFSKAQGNLQFNQVIFYDLAANGAQNITVPAGKVWKIESTANGGGQSSHIWLRNSAVQLIGEFGANSAPRSILPFWLPSGFTGSIWNGNGTSRSCISIIEFNVVP